MSSRRQIWVGGVPIGGGAPVAVQSMTKTETADYDATIKQIREIADAGGDLVRCAVPREKDVEVLKRIVVESPIPVIADIHFNYTLALKAIDAGAHCIRLNPGNIGGPDKVAQVAEKAKAAGVPMRIGVNSGSLPKHLHELERENSVEALVTAAVEFVELMERLDFTDFKVSVKSTSVPNTIASNRLLAERIDYPIHLGITEAGTKWSGSLKSAVGQGKPLRKVPQERLVDELFVEIDKSLSRGRTEFEDGKAAEGARWLQRIEEENVDELTPERVAKLEAEAARRENGGANGTTPLPQVEKVRLDESDSPTAGRRFKRV